MTDEEIYCSREYKNSFKAVFSGLLSGVFIPVCAFTVDISGVIGLILFVICACLSLFLFFRGIYIGSERLFLNKEEDKNAN